MQDNLKIFSEAINKSVESNLPRQVWSAYRNYEVRRLGDGSPDHIFIYSPQPPMNIVEHETTDGSAIGSWHYWEQDQGIDDEDVYTPLRYPGLFLEFAELYEDDPTKVNVALEKALDWAKRWGLLGCRAEGYSVSHISPEKLGEEDIEDHTVRGADGTDRCQNLVNFYLLAREANQCLRLYGAATADEPDVETLRKHGAKGETVEQLIEDALEKVGQIVQKHLEKECYPQLYYHKADNTFLKGEKGKGGTG